MKNKPKGSQAARWRQRKFQILRRYQIPPDLLPGSLSLSHLRCGKPTCHCAQGPGHPVWSLTFMLNGKKQVQHIPKDWVEEVQKRVRAAPPSTHPPKSVRSRCVSASRFRPSIRSLS